VVKGGLGPRRGRRGRHLESGSLLGLPSFQWRNELVALPPGVEIRRVRQFWGQAVGGGGHVTRGTRRFGRQAVGGGG
jgi:hypothetical protein